MKRLTTIPILVLLAGPAVAQGWACTVPYDEINGGGTVTITDETLVFRSNWPHREPETADCLRDLQQSECMSAQLSHTKNGGAAAMLRLFSISWSADGTPTAIHVREPAALFRADGDGYRLFRALPSLGYSFPLTECKPQ